MLNKKRYQCLTCLITRKMKITTSTFTAVMISQVTLFKKK